MKLKMIFMTILLFMRVYAGNDLTIVFSHDSKLNDEVKNKISTDPEKNVLFFLKRFNNKKNKSFDKSYILSCKIYQTIYFPREKN